jgi:subfamily B ATP-binding cassette protein MsbA
MYSAIAMIWEFARLFSRDLGLRLYWAFALMIAAAIVELLGVSLLLPILQFDQTSNADLISQSAQWILDVAGFSWGLGPVLTLFVILMILRSVFLMWQVRYVARVAADHLILLRSNAVAKLLGVEYQYFLNSDIGYLTNALTNEYTRVNLSVRLILNMSAKAFLAIAYLLLPLIYDAYLTLLVVISAAPVALAMNLLNRLTRNHSRIFSEQSALQQLSLIQIMRNFKYFKSTGTSENISNTINREIRSVSEASYMQDLFRGISSFAFEPIPIIFFAGLLMYFVNVEGREISEVVFVSLIFLRASKLIMTIQPTYRKFLENIGSLEVFKKLSKEFDQNHERTEGTGHPNICDDIRLDEVSFSYEDVEFGKSADGTELNMAVRDISVVIPGRSAVGVVGRSGSGKSTFVNLITGIIKPRSGEISISGTPYRDVNLKFLRSRVGFIPQEPVVFNASIEENITLWSQETDSKKLDEVLNRTALKTVLSRFVEGVKAKVGDDGSRLSGGERQRLSIARELYRDTDILILDEATSAMDSLLEKQLDRAIREEHGKRTLIIIAHRLATVKNCDQIILLHQGRISATGTFDELYQKSELFKQMVDLQQL